MKGYLFLGLAIILEFLGTMCMKMSDGFEKIIYSAGTLIFYGLCFYFFALSLKTIQLNIAYATWGGLGIILSAAVSYFFFHESVEKILLTSCQVKNIIFCDSLSENFFR